LKGSGQILHLERACSKNLKPLKSAGMPLCQTSQGMRHDQAVNTLLMVFSNIASSTGLVR